MRIEALRHPLAVPLAVFALSAALLLAAWHHHARAAAAAEQRYREARAELAAAAEGERAAGSALEERMREAARLRRHVERGWIGDEQRLVWIETLQGLAAELELPELRYDIGEQSAVAGVEGGGPRLRRSPMRLEIGARHEGEVLELLRRLRAAPGLGALERCRLERRAPADAMRGRGQRANVAARCELSWYTLTLPVEGE